ncbi:hypothetical protein CEQ90_09555 [Lewinellaceae bacterium SD302]|nr:hypothetical protein CEQ90_09555 [Lewinellaceae bacterium SD302]
MSAAPVLLTGGTGFIGHHLARGLLAAGHELRYLVRENSDLNRLPAHRHDDLFYGDLRDEYSLEAALDGCRAVVHAAALVSFQSSDAGAMERINEYGTAALVNAALEVQVPRFIHLSSVAALNRQPGKITTLKDRWQETPAPTAYARSKFAAEREVWRGQAEGLSVAVLYPSTVIGAGNWSRAGTPRLFAKAKSRRFASAGHAGFVAIDDVVAAVLYALKNDKNGLRMLLNAENLSWKMALEQIGRSVGIDRPLSVIGPAVSGALWPLAGLTGLVTGRKTGLSRDLHLTAQADYRYDGSAFEEVIGRPYRSMTEAILETGKVFLGGL